MYLVDTNVWLERLLNQPKSEEVGEFLGRVRAGDLYITDFTFHSICIILTRLARNKVLLDFDRVEKGKKTPGEILRETAEVE